MNNWEPENVVNPWTPPVQLAEDELTALGKALAPVAAKLQVYHHGSMPTRDKAVDLVAIEETDVWYQLSMMLGNDVYVVHRAMYAEYERLYRS